MSIYLTGDTHGLLDLGGVKEWVRQKSLTKKDKLIILGDTSNTWYGKKNDDKVQRFWDEQPFTTLYIDGNHENFDSLYHDYAVEEYCGGKVHHIRGSVYHLMRGEYYEIEGNTFWVMGGAESTDRAFRTKGESWWEEEVPTHDEMMYGLGKLREHQMQVDYVLTHDCSTSICRLLLGYADYPSEFTDFFDELEFKYQLNFKHWFFGHHHVDRRVDRYHTAVFNNVISL